MGGRKSSPFCKFITPLANDFGFRNADFCANYLTYLIDIHINSTYI
jgi:hypothetical protein